jgi:hypothetical protein
MFNLFLNTTIVTRLEQMHETLSSFHSEMGLVSVDVKTVSSGEGKATSRPVITLKLILPKCTERPTHMMRFHTGEVLHSLSDCNYFNHLLNSRN